MTLQDIRTTFQEIEKKLHNHSMLYLNEIKPALDKLQKDMEALWVSNDRFTELERAVADIALVVYDRPSRSRADSRIRPRPRS